MKKQKLKIDWRVLIWQLTVFLTVCLTVNCYSGQGGELHPQAGEGYSTVKKADGWNAAQLMFGETSLRIDGSWQENGMGNGFKVENNLDVPFSIDFAKMKIEIQGDTAKLQIIAINDFSSSIPQEEKGETFGDGKQLYKYYGNSGNAKSGTVGDMNVSCPPKQKCYYSVVVKFPQTKLNKSKNIEITLPPMIDRTDKTKVVFNCGTKGLLDSLTAQMN